MEGAEDLLLKPADGGDEGLEFPVEFEGTVRGAMAVAAAVACGAGGGGAAVAGIRKKGVAVSSV